MAPSIYRKINQTPPPSPYPAMLMRPSNFISLRSLHVPFCAAKQSSLLSSYVPSAFPPLCFAHASWNSLPASAQGRSSYPEPCLPPSLSWNRPSFTLGTPTELHPLKSFPFQPWLTASRNGHMSLGTEHLPCGIPMQPLSRCRFTVLSMVASIFTGGVSIFTGWIHK